MSRQQKIADAIAKRIMANTRKRFGTLYADAIEETNMATPTSSTGINTSATHDASLDRSQIGSPADGRKLNGSGTQGSGVTSGIAASQNSEVRPVTVKPVGSKTITGSYPGDHRGGNSGAGVTDFAKNAPGPRDAARQFKGSKFESDSALSTTANTEGVGA